MTPLLLNNIRGVQLLSLQMSHTSGMATLQAEVGLVDPTRLLVFGKVQLPPGSVSEASFTLLKQLAESLEKDAAAYLGAVSPPSPGPPSDTATTAPVEEGGLYDLLDKNGAEKAVGSI